MSATELRNGPVAEAIRTHRLIAVLRRVQPREELLAMVDDLAEAGVRIFEVTLDAASGAADLAAVRAHLHAGGDVLVGAGTILGREQLDEAMSAGADFGVSPLFNRALTVAALDAGLPFIPGAMTPAEIAAAWAAGATFVKLFPASTLGPSFVRELRGPLPEAALIPTGGIDAGNAAAFLAAGASAVGIGSALVRAEATTRRELVRSIRVEADA